MFTHGYDLFNFNHSINLDSKVHGANMGPIWGRQDPGGPHVGPMDLAIWEVLGNPCDTLPYSRWRLSWYFHSYESSKTAWWDFYIFWIRQLGCWEVFLPQSNRNKPNLTLMIILSNWLRWGEKIFLPPTRGFKNFTRTDGKMYHRSLNSGRVLPSAFIPVVDGSSEIYQP